MAMSIIRELINSIVSNQQIEQAKLMEEKKINETMKIVDYPVDNWEDKSYYKDEDK